MWPFSYAPGDSIAFNRSPATIGPGINAASLLPR